MLTDNPILITDLQGAPGCDGDGVRRWVVSAQMDAIAMKVRCLEFQRAAFNLDLPVKDRLTAAIDRRQVKPLDGSAGSFLKFEASLVDYRVEHLRF